jgi:hypothetical protein
MTSATIKPPNGGLKSPTCGRQSRNRPGRGAPKGSLPGFLVITRATGVDVHEGFFPTNLHNFCMSWVVCERQKSAKMPDFLAAARLRHVRLAQLSHATTSSAGLSALTMTSP